MRRMMMVPVVAAVALVALAASRPSVTVKGSDTMVILAQRWAEKYMAADPERRVMVTGGGSGTGFAALINGTTDICNASRPIKAAEVEKIRKKHKAAPTETTVAMDGIAVYVNESNPIAEISLKQLEAIYTGAVTNWKALGGNDAKIITYGRENSSGTYEFFREHVLHNRDFDMRVQTLPGTGAVVNAVVNDKNGIGYGGAAYAKSLKSLPVKADDTSKAVPPSRESVVSGTYPISRYLYMYTTAQPAGEVKAFIDFVLSKEGQSVVESVGYFPVR
jgi:phosphate transport system substrate-binding protein